MIKCHNLNKAFGSVSVLRGLSIEIEKSTRVALMGGNGSGKSKLLRILAGLDTPDAGDVVVDAYPLSGPRPGEIGMVFQNAQAYPHMTVRQNLEFPLQARSGQPDGRVDRVAGALRIQHLMARRGRKLSGGESQRVAVGRALVGLPAVLLLDEPLSGIDQSVRWELLADLMMMQEETGMTMLMVSHSPIEVEQFAHTAAVLEDGAITSHGTLSSLRSAPPTLSTWKLVSRTLPNTVEIEVNEAGIVRHPLLGPNTALLPHAPTVGTHVLSWVTDDAMPVRSTEDRDPSCLLIDPTATIALARRTGRVLPLVNRGEPALHAIPWERVHLFVEGSRVPFSVVEESDV